MLLITLFLIILTFNVSTKNNLTVQSNNATASNLLFGLQTYI